MVGLERFRALQVSASQLPKQPDPARRSEAKDFQAVCRREIKSQLNIQERNPAKGNTMPNLTFLRGPKFVKCG